MGTVNILECVRTTPSVKSFLNVTTDKVYLNKEWEWGYRENEELNGYDPYSKSKSCSELVTSSYLNSFLRIRMWQFLLQGLAMSSEVEISQRIGLFRIVSAQQLKRKILLSEILIRPDHISMCWNRLWHI